MSQKYITPFEFTTIPYGALNVPGLLVCVNISNASPSVYISPAESDTVVTVLFTNFLIALPVYSVTYKLPLASNVIPDGPLKVDCKYVEFARSNLPVHAFPARVVTTALGVILRIR